MNSITKGNLLGISALILWSTLVGLIKSASDSIGVSLATALIYSVGAIAGFLVGVPKLSKIPYPYLFGAGSVFILCEICFSQAIGMSINATQALEVGMINYLWPTLTIVFSMFINKVKLRLLIIPALIITIVGLYLCIGANTGLKIENTITNMKINPLPYILALGAAISWAVYSNLSVRLSKGLNAVPYFFAVVAIILWVRFFISDSSFVIPNIFSIIQIIFLGIILGLSYFIWEKGIHMGNFIFLAICSYFTPAISMLFASFLLKTIPPFEYWLGVIFVVIGSLLSWVSTLKKY